MSDQPAELPEDAEAQQLLDGYLRDLQAGKPADRKRILAARPDLDSMLRCIEQLDTLAPRAASDEPAPTLPPRASTAELPSSEMFESGRRIGKYEIVREIGRGGMGVVYLARDAGLDRLVAIKMILTGSLADPEQQRRFQNEIRSAARLDHEGIVRIFDTGEFSGLTYLAMQFVDGPSLSGLLRESRPDADAAVRYVIQLARAVAYLHSQGIVHRDLKPGNVLIETRQVDSGVRSADSIRNPQSPTRNLKITDFGLAKLLDDSSSLTTSNAVMGTPGYMAPEQARGESAQVGPAADIYALGAILYEMLAGRPPFIGATALEVLLQVMGNEPQPLRQINPAIPLDLEFVCLKCLEKGPTDRFATAQELADALEKHLRGEEPASPSHTYWNRLRRWTLRVPGLAARIGILVIVAMTLVIRSIVTGRFGFSPRFPEFQLPHLLGILGIWIGLSAFFQRALRTQWGHRFVPYFWASTEVAVLTTLLAVTDSIASPLDIGFPLLIAGAGLWLREKLVWFTAGVAGVGYVAATSLHFALDSGEQFHRHVIFVVGLAVTAYLVSFQVRRFRMLSRFYEGRSID